MNSQIPSHEITDKYFQVMVADRTYLDKYTYIHKTDSPRFLIIEKLENVVHSSLTYSLLIK